MRYLVTFMVCLAGLSCSKGPQIVEPPCISNQVTYFSENEACETGASVLEYEFQNEVVYVFNHGDCISDATSAVVNYDCDTLGYLGGLAGTTEINGKDFYEKAELVRAIFEN